MAKGARQSAMGRVDVDERDLVGLAPQEDGTS